ncbi:putative nucleic acid-binding protein, contains PIN domain [Candidatus Electrothrix aarhusensis]|uniref:Putative nucleic acid-binding protein, contains PIN domain n=1 Tax=Candidatus Electrothrix aarhusensis TaxID=1859131 RepID=A0A3S3U478_9BACT|nr:putative nucleic acid-binding protein, contains PIN domain [Candidatus Electrothrix aarhusensis]
MNVLFDTNVILDVLLAREPFSTDAANLLAKVERSEIIGFACATTITTIHYLSTKMLGPQAAARHIESLLALFVIAPVNRLVLENAFAAKFSDFEDAVLHEAAVHAGVQHIVARNIKDFKNASLPVYEPKNFLSMLDLIQKTD